VREVGMKKKERKKKDMKVTKKGNKNLYLFTDQLPVAKRVS